MPSTFHIKNTRGGTRNPPATPMSERQQMALLMQMTSANESGSRSPSSGRTRERNERGETPLHLAAIKGDVEQVCRLLAQRADPNVSDFAGWTPLHEACNHGWYEVAFRLVQAGANVNAKGLDNDTPLHDAVINGHLKLIRLLVDKGADIHAKNAKGKTPLDVASASIHPYLANPSLPLPESSNSTSSSQRNPPRSRDDKKVSSVAASSTNPASSDSAKQKSAVASSGAAGDSMENKSTTGAAPVEDVYEFKSVKDSDSPPEKLDTSEADTEATDPLSLPSSASNEESNKRSYPEGAEENAEKDGNDDETKRKKRKDDGGKEGNKGAQRGSGVGKTPNKQSATNQTKSTSSNAKSSASASCAADKKSPVSSPKPNVGVSNTSDAENDNASGSSDKSESLKVPPLKIVIPQSSSNEQEAGTSRNGKGSSQRAHQALPYVVASSSNDSSDKDMPSTGSPENTGTSSKDLDNSKRESSAIQADDQVTQHIESEPSTSSASNNPPPAPPPVELHPRKRKMKQRQEQVAQQAQQNDVSESGSQSREVHPHDQPVNNCYKMYMNIREQIEKRRKGLFPVLPKPPQGFNDYLMNRGSYVLAGTAPTTPNITYPNNLPIQMKDLFADQEKERYKLRMRHVIEKEKLVLSVEQEILRVHGRAARALANQSLPFSVCTILRDEEVYNLITPEQEEKDRNARSRYNGRLFLSWLQDVDDKWEKIKEHMLLRHHNEAESLHAVQKMDWEWKLKEHSLCDRKTTPKIEEAHVPMVHVSDDFDLLPA